MSFETFAYLLTGLLGTIVIMAMLIYNVVVVERQERWETAEEMRQALKWASKKKMKEQADYRAVLRGR